MALQCCGQTFIAPAGLAVHARTCPLNTNTNMTAKGKMPITTAATAAATAATSESGADVDATDATVGAKGKLEEYMQYRNNLKYTSFAPTVIAKPGTVEAGLRRGPQGFELQVPLGTTPSMVSSSYVPVGGLSCCGQQVYVCLSMTILAIVRTM